MTSTSTVRAMSLSAELCDELQILVESETLKSLCVIKLVICILGICMIVWSLATMGITWVVHPNAKVLYVFHMVLTITSSVSFGATYAIDVHRLFSANEYCEGVLYNYISYPLLTLAAYTDCCQGLAFFSMSLERLVASVKPACYEGLGSKVLALSMVATDLLIPLFYIYLMFPPDMNWSKETVAFIITSDQTTSDFRTHDFIRPSDFAIYGEYVAWTPAYSLLMPITLYLIKKQRERNLRNEATTQQANTFIPLEQLFSADLSRRRHVKRPSNMVVPM